MDLKAIKNFVLIPGRSQGQEKVYVLGERSGEYSENSFVLVPYQHPLRGDLKPVFYPVLEIKNFSCAAPSPIDSLPALKPGLQKNDYLRRVQELLHQIQLGNIYEINFCQQFALQNALIDPVAVFYNLYRISKAPYACLVKLGDNYIISASPELFLRKQGNRLETKPIKGTAPRGRSRAEDETLKHALQNSLKERTENVMAVDVARNDLSVLAARGSVSVNALYNIESFETVHQMVSTVSCELRKEFSFQEIIAATFPMASMTGAPKIRAMDLIAASENFSRDYYSGAMGLIDQHGDFSLQVIIRTIFYNAGQKHLSIAVGGAITYLSDPVKEYEECLLKAQGLLKALNSRIDH